MSEEKEPTWIICMRQKDGGTITEGSTLTNCSECDEPVWISPASVKVMLDRDCKPLCIHCVVDKPPPKRGIAAPSAEQLKEIIRGLKITENEDPTDRFEK